MSRGIVKVAHVGGATPALITQSRTFRAGIEMRSSLFYYKKKQNKTKIKPLLLHTLTMGVSSYMANKDLASKMNGTPELQLIINMK